jgi:hypothetical protein
MKTKELKEIPSLEKDKTISIWRMNHGFKSDLQGETTSINLSNKEDTKIDFSKLRIMTLVYGIYESSDLGISKISDIDMGFSEEEKKNRVKIVRRMDSQVADFLYKEINMFNTEVEDEVLKKSNSLLTEKSLETQE